MKKRISLLIAFITLGLNFAFSDNLTWTGAEDNNWDNPNNWDGGRVPGVNDNVHIPSNTPDCAVEDAHVNTLLNNGNIISNALHGLQMEVEGTLANYGNITSSSRVRISASRIENFSSAEIKGRNDNSGHSTVRLHAGQEFLNYGKISTVAGWEFGNGGSIFIFTSGSDGTGKILNYGEIIAADGVSVGDGGTVTFDTSRLLNRGNIHSGDRGESGSQNHDGRITIRAARLDNEGTIRGGRSRHKTIELTGNYGEIIMGNIDLYADTITLNPDTNLIEGQLLSIYCHYLNISNISYISGIWTTKGVHIYITPDGTADFSGVSQYYAIFSEYNEPNLIYSNSIIEPSQGLGYIFRPAPDVYPSDTTITAGYIEGVSVLINPGITDTLSVRMQNLSMLPKVLSYSINSQLGWIETTTGSSPQLQPFGFYYLELLYTIPEGTINGTSDTLELMLTIDGSGMDTSYAVIQCFEQTYVGIHVLEPANTTILYQNYPNPCSDNTTIGYRLHKNSDVVLEIYDKGGRLISVPVNDFRSAGYHEIYLSSNGLDNGIYYYVLKQDDMITGSRSLVVLHE